MTENSRLSADLEALRSRADLVGELESQVNAFKNERKESLDSISSLRRDLATARDEIKKLEAFNGHKGDAENRMLGLESEIKAQFEEKKNEFLREEKRKFEEFKAQVAAKVSKSKADYEDKNIIDDFLNTNSSSGSKHTESNDKSNIGGNLKKPNTTSKGPWDQRVVSERLLLSKASKFLESQKREVKRRQKRLEKEKMHWQDDMRAAAKEKNSRGGLSRSKRRMLKEIKRGLQLQSNDLNAAVKQLLATEKWLYEREKKVRKMEELLRQQVENDSMDESSLFGESFDFNGAMNIAGGSSSQSPDTSDLERLSDELDSDFSNMSMADNATAFDPSSGGWKASKRNKARTRQKTYKNHPQMQWATHGNMYQAWGNPNPYGMNTFGQGLYARGFGSRVPMSNISNDRVIHGFVRGPGHTQAFNDAENINAQFERQWMDRNRPSSERFGNINNGMVSNPDIQHRLSVFQNQLKRWSGEQKTAFDAVGNHSKWLKKFGSEMNKFSLYQNKRTANEGAIGGTGGKSTGMAVLSPRVKHRTVNQIMADVNESFSKEV